MPWPCDPLLTSSEREFALEMVSLQKTYNLFYISLGCMIGTILCQILARYN